MCVFRICLLFVLFKSFSPSLGSRGIEKKRNNSSKVPFAFLPNVGLGDLDLTGLKDCHIRIVKPVGRQTKYSLPNVAKNAISSCFEILPYLQALMNPLVSLNLQALLPKLPP